jgi:3-deoxy-D-manno-octulosonate 8-phosphate phosphatase (KDO 8-P phosphatase)
MDRVVSASAPGLWLIDAGEALARAGRVGLVLTDCDGVLTDGTVYCSAIGEELLRFSRRDGMGVELLRAAHIETAIVTRERSPIVERRAEKLAVRLYAGVRDKRELLAQILAEHGRGADQVAYIGDDLNDYAVLREVGVLGLTGAPSDAEPVIREAVHFVSARAGGQGAFREFADFILGLRERRGTGGVIRRRTP